MMNTRRDFLRKGAFAGLGMLTMSELAKAVVSKQNGNVSPKIKLEKDRIWEKRDSLDIDKNFDSYIFTIARNLVYDEWDSLFHAELYMKSLEADWDERDTSKVEEDITVNSIGQYIDSLIDKLPVSRREIFLLSRKEHLSTKEIAQRLSISERTVEAQIYRSLQFLRKYLAEEGILLWLLSFVVNEY